MTGGPQLDRGTPEGALYDEGIPIAEQCEGRLRCYQVQRQIRCEDRRKPMVAVRLWPLLGDTRATGPAATRGRCRRFPTTTVGAPTARMTAPVGRTAPRVVCDAVGPKQFDPGAAPGSAESAQMAQSLTSSAENREESSWVARRRSRRSSCSLRTHLAEQPLPDLRSAPRESGSAGA